MADFMFDPPLSLKGGVMVRTLEQAAAFARNLINARLPRGRDGVLHLLEAASGEKREREAADAFRAWVEAEGLIRAR